MIVFNPALNAVVRVPGRGGDSWGVIYKGMLCKPRWYEETKAAQYLDDVLTAKRTPELR